MAQERLCNAPLTPGPELRRFVGSFRWLATTVYSLTLCIFNRSSDDVTGPTSGSEKILESGHHGTALSRRVDTWNVSTGVGLAVFQESPENGTQPEEESLWLAVGQRSFVDV